MNDRPSDPVLADWAKWLDNVGWATFILDKDYKIAWVSDELKQFLGEHDPETLMYGHHLAAAFFTEAWTGRITPESRIGLFQEAMPLILGDEELKRAVLESVPDDFRPLVEGIEPRPMPYTFSASFDYEKDDLPPYQVNVFTVRINDDDGNRLGAIFLFFMGVKPNLVTLLARGDQSMYERMSNLVDPQRREGAILFADLQSSGMLSRQLPTVQYFNLARQLATSIDEVVGRNSGVVGKHAGDGGSAFFLTLDLGSESAAAAAAITAARELQERVEALDVPMHADLGHCILNVGLHWGAGLYMGQLVPGGRLDVTALGDEVNECARLQESARDGALLATKSLVERLNEDDAAAVGIQPEKLTYSTLADFPDATDKARQDAGGLPVTRL